MPSQVNSPEFNVAREQMKICNRQRCRGHKLKPISQFTRTAQGRGPPRVFGSCNDCAAIERAYSQKSKKNQDRRRDAARGALPTLWLVGHGRCWCLTVKPQHNSSKLQTPLKPTVRARRHSYRFQIPQAKEEKAWLKETTTPRGPLARVGRHTSYFQFP